MSAHTATHGDDPSLKFSTLAKLNAECSKWNGGNKDLVGSEESLCVDINSYQPERSVGQNPKKNKIKKPVDLTSAYLAF